MERLLTPLVNRVLSQYVISSEEGEGISLSVSGGGTVTLHNLELDLSSALPAGLETRRAFARSLRVKIPWTSLNTQPIEVVLDTVEIILGEALQLQAVKEPVSRVDVVRAASPPPSASPEPSGRWLGGGSWLGSNLQSILQRAGLNVSVTVKNLVVKWLAQEGSDGGGTAIVDPPASPDRNCDNLSFALAMAVEKLEINSCPADEWQHLVERPEAWLKKRCVVRGLSISLDPTDTARHQTFLPLLRMSSLDISALLPIFAYLEGADVGGDEVGVAVSVDVGSVSVAANDRQMKWSDVLFSAWRAAKECPAAGDEAEFDRGADVDEGGEEGDGGVPGSQPSTPQIRALGLFGKIWDYAVGEAEYLRKLEEREASASPSSAPPARLPPPQPAPSTDAKSIPVVQEPPQIGPGAAAPTQAELTVNLHGLRVQLGTVVVLDDDTGVIPLLDGEVGHVQLRTASFGTEMRDVELVVADVVLRHNAAAAPAVDDGSAQFSGLSVEWDEALGLHACSLPSELQSPSSTGELHAVELRWSGDDGSDAVAGECIVTVGRVLMMASPAFIKTIRTCLGWMNMNRTRAADEAAVEEMGAKTETARGTATVSSTADDHPQSRWTGATSWSFSVSRIDLVAEGEKGSAAVLRSTAPITFLPSTSRGKRKAPSLSSSFELAIVYDATWKSSQGDRAAALAAAAHPLSNVVTLTGSILPGQAGSLKIEFVSSPVVMEADGRQLDLLAAALGRADGNEPGTFRAFVGKAVVGLELGLRFICDELGRSPWIVETPRASATVAFPTASPGVDGATLQFDAYNLRSVSGGGAMESSLSLSLLSLSCLDASRPSPSSFEAHAASAADDLATPAATDATIRPTGSTPIGLLSGFEMCFTAQQRSIDCQSLSIAVDAAALAVLRAVAASMTAWRQGTPPGDSPLHIRQHNQQQMPAQSQTKSFSLAVFSFTAFPSTGASGTNDSFSTGISGWASALSVTLSEGVDNYAIGNIGLGLRRHNSSHDGIGDVMTSESLRFVRENGPEHCVVTANVVKSPQRREFSITVKPMELKVTPMLVDVAHLLRGNDSSPAMAPLSIEPPSFLHGRMILGGVSIDLVACKTWDDGAMASPAASVCIDETFCLVHQDDARERRPWLSTVSNAPIITTTVRASLMGASTRVYHEGPPGADVTEVMLPADINFCFSRHARGHSVLAIEAESLSLKISKSIVGALEGLRGAYGGSRGSTDISATTTRDDESGTVRDDRSALSGYGIVDDLSCGVFVMSKARIATLIPHTVAVLHDHDRDVFQWSYVHPRVMSGLFIEGVWPDVAVAQLDLLRFDGPSRAFERVDIDCVAIKDGTCVIPRSSIAAETWRFAWALCDSMPPPSDLLTRLRVNPTDAAMWRDVGSMLGKVCKVPQPLLAPSTIALAVHRADVSLIAAQAPSDARLLGAHALNCLGSIQFEDLLSITHAWDDARTAALQTTVAVDCVGAATLAEKCTVQVEFERDSSTDSQPTLFRTEPAPLTPLSSVASAVLAGLRTDATAGFSTLQDPLRLAARSYPSAHGKNVQCSFITPLVINFSEQAKYAVLRAAALATADSSTPLQAPVKITNNAAVDFLIRQYGSSDILSPVRVGAGASEVDFHWDSTRGQAAGSPELALQLAVSGRETSWSYPIDVLAPHGYSIPLKFPASNGAVARVAVAVAQADGSLWHVRISPGLRICNRMNIPLSFHQNSPSDGSISGWIAPLDSTEVASCDAAPVRVWLGTRWSTVINMSALQSDDSPTVQILHPELCSMPAPPDAEERAPCIWKLDDAVVLAEYLGIDKVSGHITIAIWPPAMLENSLAVPLWLAPGATSAHLGAVKVEPFETFALPVGVRGGAIARMNLLKDAPPDDAATWTVIYCPPLGKSKAAPAPDTTSAVAFVESPGEAVPLRLAASMKTTLPCFLATEAHGGTPGLLLRLVPQYSIVNLLPMPIVFQITDELSVNVPPEGLAPFDLSSVDGDRRFASVALTSTKTLSYRSPSFPFGTTGDMRLTLAPLQASTEESTAAEASILLESFAAMITVEHDSVGEDAVVERVTISPSGYLTNKTEHNMQLRCPTPSGNSTVSTLDPGTTLPFLVPTSEFVEISLGSQGGGSVWHPVLVSGDALGEAYGRVYHRPSEATYTSTISYRASISEERTRIVLFSDSQPAVTVRNESSEGVDVSWRCGTEQFFCTVSANDAIDLELSDPVDDEALMDIEPFLASIAPTDRHAYMPPPTDAMCVLLRRHGVDEWSEVPLNCIATAHEATGLRVSFERRGASIDVTIRDQNAPEKVDSFPPNSFGIHCAGLRLVMWDDGRGRITGSKGAPHPVFAVQLNDISCTASESLDATAMRTSIGRLQCNSMLPTDRAVLWSSEESQEAIRVYIEAGRECETKRPNRRPTIWVKNVNVEMAPLSLDVDDTTLLLSKRLKELVNVPEPIIFARLASREDKVATSLATVQADAEDVAASRFYVEEMTIGSITATADIHLSSAATGLPVAIDTAKSPLSISPVQARFVSLQPAVLTRGLASHLFAEALLNAPVVLGSLQLFFNPTGLVHSIRKGVADLIEFPRQGLQQGPLQFIAGMGQGSASLVREISDWSVSSVVGFSRAASNALFRRRRPSETSLPDIVPEPSPQSASPLPETSAPLPPGGLLRLVEDFTNRGFERSLGQVVAYSIVQEIIVYQGKEGDIGAFQLNEPTLLLTTEALVLYGESGSMPSLVAWLSGASLTISDAALRVDIATPHAAPFTAPESCCAARVVAAFSRTAWARMGPLFRRLRNAT